MSLAVDVPDEDELVGDLPSVDDGARVDRP
jgi:hypothetical protein